MDGVPGFNLTPEDEDKKQVEEPPKEPQPGTTPPPGQPEGEKEQVQAKAPAALPKPGEEAPKVEPATEQSLKDVLKEVLAESKTQPAPKTEEKKKDPGPQYNPNIPDELWAAMNHDDPGVRRQATNIMIGGAMSKVYEDLKKHVTAELATMAQQIPQILAQQETVKQKQKEAHDKFYGENPNFGSTPARKRLVTMLAMNLASEMNAAGTYKGTDDAFWAKLADVVVEATGIPKGKAAAAAAAPTKPPAKPAFQAPAAPSRATEAGAPSLQEEIADVIGMTLN